MKNKKTLLLFMLLWGFSQLQIAQSVREAPAGSLNNLDSKWVWAMNSAKKIKVKNGFYICYTFLKEKDDQKYSRECWDDTDKKTLHEIIYRKPLEQNILDQLKKEIAVIFYFKDFQKNKLNFQKMEVHKLNHPVKINNIPLFFLGKMETGESIGFLNKCFKNNTLDCNRKKIVTAVGIHDPCPQGFNFLKKVLNGDFSPKIRKSAAFWIGVQQHSESVKILLRTVYNDQSSEVRKHAVFAIYLIKSKEADNALIQIVRKCDEKNIRKKAIFWLGQKAVKRCAKILENVVYNDPDEDIKAAAVFALSQHPHGVSKLIRIAKTHPGLKVRKKAIFWLS